MPRHLMIGLVATLLFSACSTPNDETSEIACENAACPPGTTIDLNASSINQCEVGGSVKVLSREGEVDAKCYAEGSCSYICVPPVCCGGEKWTLDSYECEISCCPDGTAPPCKTACGNGECDGDESPETCPQDCADTCGDGDCTGEESPETCPTDCGCIPACVDKICGDDGCGGSCGGCPDPAVDICHAKCEAGQCVAMFVEDEICDGKDNDCDGVVDNDFPDPDEDGKADCVDLDDDGDGTVDEEDCEPWDPDVHPDAEELCNDKDDNCDGEVDEEDAIGCQKLYKDEDEDDFGLQGDSKCLCAAVEPYEAEVPGDCDDAEDDVNPDGVETCDGLDNDCDDIVDPPDTEGCSEYFVDLDTDGFGVEDQQACLCQPEYPYVAVVTGDCDENSAEINPDANEKCNQVDDNCDDIIDSEDSEGCEVYYLNGDGDPVGVELATKCLCGPAAPYDTQIAGDCEDDEPGIYPGQIEKCNGFDDNCDDLVDPIGLSDCIDYFFDGDKDGHGDSDDSICACGPQGLYTQTAGLDCDDENPAIYPGAEEICNGVDDNCDDIMDPVGAPGCTDWYQDVDEDNFGNPGNAKCQCAASETHPVDNGDDCNDLNKDVSPVAEEICNQIDDNCDNEIDPEDSGECEIYYKDEDIDQFGMADDAACLCTALAPYLTKTAGDCNDDNDAIHPGVTELCNQVDDDCDGIVDPEGATQGCMDYFQDGDSDGFGDPAGPSICTCGAQGEFKVANDDDCNDDNKDIHPDAAETCNGYDDNCDETVDQENSQGCVAHYLDNDHDGYGDPQVSPLCLCWGKEYPAYPNYTTAANGDCDDTKKGVYPGAPEVCNGLDDNCDQSTDPEGTSGCSTAYYDADGDTYAMAGAQTKCLCAGDKVKPWSGTQPGDCNDQSAVIKPGANEVCDDKDNNCDGQTDPENSPGCTNYYYSGDGDLFAADGTTDKKCLCVPEGPYLAVEFGDCSDFDAEVFPGATEVCNFKDDDCDGIKDPLNLPGCEMYYPDNDYDDVGDANSPGQCACSAQSGFTKKVTGDCDDDDKYVGSCKYRLCGEDGCGNLCGTCAAGESCCSYPPGYGPGWNGEINFCDVDNDSDGVCGNYDKCPDSPPGEPVCANFGCRNGDHDINGCLGYGDAMAVYKNIVEDKPNSDVLCMYDFNADGVMTQADLDDILGILGWGDNPADWPLTPECECQAGYLPCANGSCKEEKWFCNGIPNNPCKIDEVGCPCVNHDGCGQHWACVDGGCCKDTDEDLQCDPDTDGDWMVDHQDNCPNIFNFWQKNKDWDEFGNACDPDKDGDGVDAAAGDCDDWNQGIYPGNDEVCGNGKDDDCNAATPDDC